MALGRGEIPLTVSTIAGAAVSGASVSVNIRGVGPATVYAAETGSTTLANPLTTTAEGRIDGWLPEGSYDLTISGSGIATYTQSIEVVNGKSIVNIPGDRITANTIPGASLADGGVTGGKIAAGTITHANLDPSVLPVGTIIQWWRPSSAVALPGGYVLADGSTYSSTQHDFGTGASITVPDLRNKFLLGADPTKAQGAAGTPTVAPGVGGAAGAHLINLSHAHTNNDHYHLAQGLLGAWAGNQYTDDHLHSVGSYYAPSHGHHFAAYTSGAVNFVGSRAQGSLSGTSSTHQHYVESDTWGNGNMGLGGASGASDRTLFNRGNTSGMSDRGMSAALSTAQDIRPAHVGVVFLIKIKAS